MSRKIRQSPVIIVVWNKSNLPYLILTERISLTILQTIRFTSRNMNPGKVYVSIQNWFRYGLITSFWASDSIFCIGIPFENWNKQCILTQNIYYIFFWRQKDDYLSYLPFKIRVSRILIRTTGFLWMRMFVGVNHESSRN